MKIEPFPWTLGAGAWCRASPYSYWRTSYVYAVRYTVPLGHNRTKCTQNSHCSLYIYIQFNYFFTFDKNRYITFFYNYVKCKNSSGSIFNIKTYFLKYFWLLSQIFKNKSLTKFSILKSEFISTNIIIC